jgi:branched-chain amino acid aminotransferase
MGIYLQQKIKEAGAGDVLYVKNGYISELVRSNVFAVTHQNELITSDSNVLYGITRKHILQVAAQTMDVKEQAVSLHDVLHAKEVFVSSTTKRLLPVFSVNGNKIGNGNAGTVTTDLYQRFLELEHQVIGKGW